MPGFFGGGGGGGAAKQARKDELARQRRIREGTKRINQIFDGGTFGVGQIGRDASFDPNDTYYLEDGSVWEPPSLDLPFDNPFNKGLRINSFLDAAKGGELYKDANTTSGFDDDFFRDRRQAYLDYASPQLDEQYEDAQRELTFALARRGQTDSSIRGQQVGELQQLYDRNKQQVADEALSYENQSRNAVEDARSNLLTTLSATGNAQQAANSAVARAQALSQPQSYSPLTQLFAGFTEGLGTYAAANRADRAARSAGLTADDLDRTGLFGPRSSAVRVRG